MSVFLLVFLLLQLQNPNSCHSLSSDGLSLLALKSAVDQTSSGAASAFSDWNEDDDTPCRWTGVSCMNVSGSSDPRVVAVAVAGKSLRGYIPSELGTLVFLRRLNLHGNNFYGSIPDQLFNASSLHSIFLYGNNLSGPLPLPSAISPGCRTSICSPARFRWGSGRTLVNLVQLDLSSNQFNGRIPNDLGELKSLSGTLNLSYNRFSGEIPRSLGNLPVEVSFDLRNNNLSGEIPQTGAFANQGPTAFLGNPSLCGFPLQKSCRNSPQNSPGSSGVKRESRENSKKGLKPTLIMLISLADAAGVALIGLIIVYIYWKKKDSKSCSCTGRSKFVGEDGGERGGRGDLVALDKGFTFELDELLRASAYVLGKSGLGIVYKVVLGNGVPVAVRRLGEGGGQRYKEFAAEVQAIGRVKHPNIVKLRAYYWAPDEKLLISDFISNGNLGSALRGRVGQSTSGLSWHTRLRIAKGTARGLAYLHECSPRKFVHGHLKPSNILLDSDFNSYISDFGLNKLISITSSDSSSSGGLIGSALPYIKPPQTERVNNYRAPEARVPGSRPTQKWDVYSFGVVLLEMLTGKSPEFSPPTTSTSIEVPDLVRWVKKGFEEENPLSDMVDPALLQEVHAKKEVLAVFHVALACTESDPEIRPRMKTVCENLDRIGT
ncbi:hypothetical protein Syun_024461 [Stephania yunnanensis]|uniref:non-specific serine/threonine protein kinase n=1 Tax=Stephania yunnanensis TaxID=152371 RepID=A0AAP0I4H8_9MAGN